MWRRSAHVAFVDDGDRVMLLDVAHPRSARPQLLAGSAADIWRAIDGVRTTTAIVDTVANRFEFSQPTLPAEVLSFLDCLSDAGLASPSRL